MDDESIGGDELIGDDTILRRVEIEQFCRLRLTCFDGDVDLAYAARLPHPIFILITIGRNSDYGRKDAMSMD